MINDEYWSNLCTAMYTLREIAQFIDAHPEGDTSRTGNWLLLIDSRTLVQPENSIFFALRTHQNDGHHYIGDLIARGVSVFVVNTDFQPVISEGIVYLKVSDTLNALQMLAKMHRQHFNIPVIGITGSNGKTIVKEWLTALLSPVYNICASPKSYNSQIGVPVSVWQLNEKHTLGVFEAGISRPGEMQHLQHIIQPDIGILTHMGSAHDEGFTDFGQKADEKLRLFADSKVVLLRYDAALIEKINTSFLTFGFNEEKADLNITLAKTDNTTTTLNAVYMGADLSIRIPFSDEASIENACLCWLTVLYLNSVNTADFMNLTAVSMRLELKQAMNNCLLINDSYSNDLNALSAAFSFLKRQSVHTKTTVILSDIEQSGLQDADLCREISRILSDNRVDRFFAIGEHLYRNMEYFQGHYSTGFYHSTDEFLERFDATAFENETILLKGARSFKFEKIAARLEKQTHGTLLEIDLTAVQHNLNYIKGKLPAGMKIMAMVKAFAYGSGSYEIAKLLEKKVDYLAVAYTDEGVTLRQNGLHTPIMVMNADQETFRQCITFQLEPVVFSLSQLRSLISVIGQQSIHIHLEFDTGMHRLGFSKSDLQDLTAILRDHTNLRVSSVFSHLSASDESVYDTFTQQQFAQFIEIGEAVESLLAYPVLKHISNTAAALRFKQTSFSMVRLGIGLYGIDPSGEHQRNLETVFTLKTTISQIKTIAPNESIGYARKAIENRERKIAVLAIGYADGLNRLLSNGKGSFLINGMQAPIIGNVCMDMCMVDVSAIVCSEGDDAILFGKDKSIIELAGQLQTIPYEILTSVSQRVKRVYVSE